MKKKLLRSSAIALLIGAQITQVGAYAEEEGLATESTTTLAQGNVTSVELDNEEKVDVVFEVVGDGGELLEGVNIELLDLSDNVIEVKKSNEFGRVVFNVPVGTTLKYYLPFGQPGVFWRDGRNYIFEITPESDYTEVLSLLLIGNSETQKEARLALENNQEVDETTIETTTTAPNSEVTTAPNTDSAAAPNTSSTNTSNTGSATVPNASVNTTLATSALENTTPTQTIKVEDVKLTEVTESTKQTQTDETTSTSVASTSYSTEAKTTVASKQLPNTGEATNYAIFSAAALSVLAGVGLFTSKRYRDNA